jgi:hypothetical protein
VVNEHDGGRKAKCVGLRRCRDDELLRSGEDTRDAARLEISDVVHTARRATASIGECLDHYIAVQGNFLAEIYGRGLGERGLGVASHLPPPRCQTLRDLVEEHVAARLGDIEESDG